jgi:hypothetical protein
MTSWEGLSEDPRPFARLNPERRVLLLEGHPDNGTVLGEARNSGSNFPRTDAQYDADGWNDRGGGGSGRPESVVNSPGRAENAIALQTQSYHNYKVIAPRNRAVQAPDAMTKVGLLTPADRRAIMEFEKQNLLAKRVRQQSDLDHSRRVGLMACRHPEGCLGLDGPGSAASEAYGAKGDMMLRQRDHRQRHANARAERLRQVSSSVANVPYDMLDHDMAVKTAQETKVFQEKTGVRQYLDTTNRIFDNSAYIPSVNRMQSLRNEDLGGKQYNIVTHTNVPVAPSNMPLRMDHREAHPSIINYRLERGNQYNQNYNNKPIANATGL